MNILWGRFALPVVVFLTGAAVLVIEVVATRMLSPYFGNTLYTVSSVLGVVLAALSAGYYLGGRLSDTRPSMSLFFALIFGGGTSVLLLQLLAVSVLPSVGYQLSIVSGPLVMSGLLFFLPSLLLGMLSPFAITLQQRRLAKTGIGTISGEIFFFSTLGSIVGSLLSGFVLVPLAGIDSTVTGVGVFLVLLGTFGLLAERRSWRLLLKCLGIPVVLLAGTIGLLLTRQEPVLYSHDGLYEKLVITDDTHKGRPTRFFIQDRSSSSAMYLNSDELVFDYTKYYELFKGVKPNASRALVIGGAAYSVPKALLARSTTMQVDVAEIEPSLEQLARRYFRLPNASRLKTHLVDGRRWLSTAPRPYDFIFSDVYYSLYSIPPHFTTKEFFETAKRQLTPNGMFIANLIGRLGPEKPSFVLSEIKTFQGVFANCAVFAVRSPHSAETQNIMLVGIKGSQPLDVRAPVFTGSTNNVLKGLSQHQVDVSQLNLAPHLTLTDNYAPVEFLVSKTLLGKPAP